MFDRIIRGGQVFDGVDLHRADVAMRDNHIAAVGMELGDAREVVDATDLLICPGLVDLHAHSYVGAKNPGVDPDLMAVRSGVTTVADPGSAPLLHFDDFLNELDTRKTRIVIFLSQYRNYGELATLNERRRAIEKYRDRIFGLKVVVFPDEAGEGGLQTLRDARVLGDEFGLPLMIHYTVPSSYASAAFSLVGPGDIVAHLFWDWDSGLFGADENISSLVSEAQGRGAIVDVAHGGGKFRFDVAKKALELGLQPNTISTDLHAGCVCGPVFDLPTTASKLLNLGMPLMNVLQAITSSPSSVLGLAGAGHIAVGLPADIALLRLEKGTFTFVDANRTAMTGEQRLVCVRTLTEGFT